MANKITNTQYYSDIADAIRSKNGSSDTYTPAQMATAISNISTFPVGTKCACASPIGSVKNIVREINKISSQYTDMDYMFYLLGSTYSFGSGFPIDLINSFDVSNVTSMKYMFNNINFEGINLSNWDVSNVTNMEGMFAGLVNYNFATLGISSWNVSSVTNMRGMFKGFRNEQSLSMDLSSWDTSNVTDMYDMFNGDSNIVSLNLSGWDISNVTNMSYMFQGCSSLQHLDIRNMDFSNVTSYSRMFGAGGTRVPANCEIIVKDQAAKDFILNIMSDFTNIVIAS